MKCAPSAFEQGAEDGGLDVLPLLPGGLFQEAELEAIDREHGVIGKEAAIELKEFFPQHDRDALAGAGVHFLEELAKQVFKAGAIARHFIQQLRKSAIRQQAHVFGEHAEEAAREELRDDLGLVTGLLQ